jgi:hypothetical protein
MEGMAKSFKTLLWNANQGKPAYGTPEYNLHQIIEAEFHLKETEVMMHTGIFPHAGGAASLWSCCWMISMWPSMFSSVRVMDPTQVSCNASVTILQAENGGGDYAQIMEESSKVVRCPWTLHNNTQLSDRRWPKHLPAEVLEAKGLPMVIPGNHQVIPTRTRMASVSGRCWVFSRWC